MRELTLNLVLVIQFRMIRPRNVKWRIWSCCCLVSTEVLRSLKGFPKVHEMALELAELIDECVGNNDMRSWHNLLCFAYHAFQTPIRKSKLQSLARLVKQNRKK